MSEHRDVEKFLFASYAKQRLIGWARLLNYFRYSREEWIGKEPSPDTLTALRRRMGLRVLLRGFLIEQETIERARVVEKVLASVLHHLQVIDPPRDSPYCFCPKYYPEYW